MVPKMTRYTIRNIEENMYQAANIYAVKNGMTIGEVISGALDEYIFQDLPDPQFDTGDEDELIEGEIIIEDFY